MPRKKISEHCAKTLVCKALGIMYVGYEINSDKNIAKQLELIVPSDSDFVVKVDQGIKGRYKMGLVKLNVPLSKLEKTLEELAVTGYHWFIVEPMFEYEKSNEKFLSMSRIKDGLAIAYSDSGGVDVELKTNQINQILFSDPIQLTEIAGYLKLSKKMLTLLINCFNDNFFSFLEINPYVVNELHITLLDLAVEVDDAGMFYVEEWGVDDFRRPVINTRKPEELLIQELDEKSPASFKLDIMNKNGAIFLLLSGGGASIVVADEIHLKGYGEQIANYGEYSGNPTLEETKIYASAVIDLLLKSRSPKKVLLIAGAVANFTDIANTFKGIIDALEEKATILREQNIQVVVRRGGPRQDVGLALIKAALDRWQLKTEVFDPKTSLTYAVERAIEAIK